MQGDVISALHNVVTERIVYIRKIFQPNFLFPGKVLPVKQHMLALPKFRLI